MTSSQRSVRDRIQSRLRRFARIAAAYADYCTRVRRAAVTATMVARLVARRRSRSLGEVDMHDASAWLIILVVNRQGAHRHVAARGALRTFNGADVVEVDAGANEANSINRAIEATDRRWITVLRDDVAIVSPLPELRDHEVLAGAITSAGRVVECGRSIAPNGARVRRLFGESAATPAFQFTCSVGSASPLMWAAPRELMLGLGGLSLDAVGWEVEDLSCRSWASGYAVRFEPAMRAELIGGTAPLLLRIRHDNERLASRHAPLLEKSQGEFRGIRRADSLSILVVDDGVPVPSLGQGGPRTQRILRTLAFGHDVVLYSTVHELPSASETYRVVPRNVEIAAGYLREGLRCFLRARAHDLDVVIVSRPHNMRWFLRAQSRLGAKPHYRVLYDAEAVFALRDAARLSSDDGATTRAIEQELDLGRHADAVTCVSDGEAARFRTAGAKHVTVLGHAPDVRLSTRPFAERDGLLFVGPLTAADSPNADGIAWLAREVLPLIRDLSREPVSVRIVGRAEPAVLEGLALDEAFDVCGPVDDLGPVYDDARVFVAPLRFGAGIPLKIVDAAAAGIPVVTTPLAEAQLDWRNDDGIAVGDTAKAFAEACIRLYRSELAWETMRAAALARVQVDFSLETFERTLADVLRELVRDPR